MLGDFPGGLVVKTSPSSVRGAGSVPGHGAEIPPASWPKHQKSLKKKINTVTCNKGLKKWSISKNMLENMMLAVNHRYICWQPFT